MTSKKYYKNIIWDWNGTLLDDIQVCSDLVNSGLEKIGRPRYCLQQQREMYAIPIIKYYESFGVTPEEYRNIAGDFLDKHKSLLPSISLRSKIIDALTYAKSNNIKQYVLSSHLQDHIEEGLALKEIKHYFDAVYGLPQGSSGLPKSEIGRKLIVQHEIIPNETVLFGDSVHDYEVAQEIGVDCVLVAGGHQCDKKLRATGARVVEDTSQIISILS
jgi:phosphoglycolate phosphatase